MKLSDTIRQLLEYIVEQAESEEFNELSSGQQLGMVTTYISEIADAMPKNEAQAMIVTVREYNVRKMVMH